MLNSSPQFGRWRHEPFILEGGWGGGGGGSSEKLTLCSSMIAEPKRVALGSSGRDCVFKILSFYFAPGNLIINSC